jgi:hypothetical protein
MWRGGVAAIFGVGAIWLLTGMGGATKFDGAQASFDGLGPVLIGMTIPQVEKALGIPLAVDSFGNEDMPCQRAWPSSGLAQVHFMAVHNAIQRIDIEDQSIATDRGAKIGDSEERIRSLYPPPILERPDPNFPEGHYMIVSSADGKRALLFATDGEVVLTYRVGERRAIEQIAGCE